MTDNEFTALLGDYPKPNHLLVHFQGRRRPAKALCPEGYMTWHGICFWQGINEILAVFIDVPLEEQTPVKLSLKEIHLIADEADVLKLCAA